MIGSRATKIAPESKEWNWDGRPKEEGEDRVPDEGEKGVSRRNKKDSTTKG